MRRLASAADLCTVYALYMHEKVVPFLGYDPMPLEAFAPLFEALCASGSFYVYEVEGALAGFYKTTRFPGRAQHVASLGTLAVDPRGHGQGVARDMVTGAIRDLQAAGVLRIELCAEADNPQAIRFYEKLGFVHEGTLRGFYKRAGDPGYVDERLMALVVGPARGGVQSSDSSAR